MRQNPTRGDGATGPFAEAAAELVEYDLVPIPCNGKRPLIKGWQKETPAEAREKLPGRIKRFGGANVGVSCGASQIVETARFFMGSTG